MKTFNASRARARLAEVLDLAESGQPVAIERGGVSFRVELRKATTGGGRSEPYFDLLDPAVTEGGWSWAWDEGGLRFAAAAARATGRRRRRP